MSSPDVILAAAGVPSSEALFSVGTLAAIRAGEAPDSALAHRWHAIRQIASAPPGARLSIAVLANLTDADLALVTGLVALLTDPAQQTARTSVIDGTAGITIRAGEAVVARVRVESTSSRERWLFPDQTEAQYVRVLAAVHKVTGITAELILGPTRPDPVVWARHVAISLFIELTQVSLECAARRFGRTDHGTALNAIRMTRHWVETSPTHADQYARIRADLGLKPTVLTTALTPNAEVMS